MRTRRLRELQADLLAANHITAVAKATDDEGAINEARRTADEIRQEIRKEWGCQPPLPDPTFAERVDAMIAEMQQRHPCMTEDELHRLRELKMQLIADRARAVGKALKIANRRAWIKAEMLKPAEDIETSES